MKYFVLKMTIALMISAYFPAKSFALVLVCADETVDDCWFAPGDCSAYPNCHPMSTQFNPNSDAIVTKNGHAYISSNGKLTPIASDKRLTFLSSMKTKYVKMNKNDKSVQAQIKADFIAFKKTDDGIVSSSTLAKISSETKLSIKALPNETSRGK